MKKHIKIGCIFLAALMLLSVFGVLFAQLSFAIEVNNDGLGSSNSSSNTSSSNTSSSSDTSSEVDETPADQYSGTLRMYEGPFFYRASHDGAVSNEDTPDKTQKKGPLYLVELTVIDSSVFIEDEGQIIPDSVYVSSTTGSNFTTVMKNNQDFEPAQMEVLGVVGGSPRIRLKFYVSYDGKGKMMNLEAGYTYETPEQNSTKQAKGTFSMRINTAVLNPDAVDDSIDAYLVATPNIIVTSYNYGNKDIMAGYDFPLTITYTNTSKELGLENIIMDITTSTDLAIANGSNSTFIPELEKGASQTKTFMITASGSIEPKPQKITVKFSYQYILKKARVDGTRSEELAVPIVQLDRFTVGEMSVPQQIYPQDNVYISIDYVNKGKTEVPNLSARLVSDTPGVGDSQAVGNVKAGDNGTIDFQFTAPNTPGPLSGTVVVTYEDARGIEKSVERPFSAQIMDMGGFGGEQEEVIMPMEPEETGLTTATKVMAMVGGLMVAGLTATVIIKKAKLKREEENDEDI